MVVLEELIIFLAIKILHMICNRNILEWVDLLRLIVTLNIAEESLLITEVPVILQMVVHSKLRRTVILSHLCSLQMLHTSILV